MEREIPLSPSQQPATCSTNRVQALPIDFFTMHFNIIFPSTAMSYKWSLFFGVSNQNRVASTLSLTTATCAAHLIRLF
jgi:hypothetical protein